MKILKEVFLSAESRAELASNQLDSFAALWELEAPWFEEPNSRGQGYSGVITHQLKCADGSSKRIFIKKQQDYTTATLTHPIKGMATFEREYNNIVRLSALGVPAIELLYFATAEHQGKRRAILVSYALDEFTPLDKWFAETRQGLPDATVQTVLRAVVDAIKPIHEGGYRHGCLYGKHIFVRLLGSHDNTVITRQEQVEVRMLDFEKAHKSLFLKKAILKDLSQFVRHFDNLPEADLKYFFEQYGAGQNSTGLGKFVQKQIEKK